MVPPPTERPEQYQGAPRASGDGPLGSLPSAAASSCSPRERGWSRGAVVVSRRAHVLPARAGMVPVSRHVPAWARRAPRASGDGPSQPGMAGRMWGCSPRERGWSLLDSAHRLIADVLPARAGMVPRRPTQVVAGHGAPRASGDGPYSELVQLSPDMCSPRERGWSRLTTSAHT